MGPVVNPFWSIRARDEAALQSSRPVDLPVPSGDEAELDHVLEGGTSVQMDPGEASSLVEKRGRTGKGQGSDGAGRERFSTPASWQDGRPQGQLGSGSGSVKQELPKRTEGEMPPDDGGQSLFGGSVTEENGLQRALEKEMVERLHQENVQLKFEMEQLKRIQAMAEGGTTTTSWSEVSIPGEGVPPPPPRSRSPTRRCLQKQEEKFTPQGTRVPDTPPPSDDATLPAVPPWPWGTDGYEKSEMDGPCQRSWGPSLRGGVRYLSREGRPRQQRDWRDEDWPLRGRDRGDVQGDVLSRHGEPDEVMDAATARAEWLRQELMTLQLQMERDARRSSGKLSSDYWKQPIARQEQQLGREGHWGVRQQAPLSRAGYEGDCHQAPQCRANSDGRLGDNRAQQDGRQSGDRAQQDGRLSGDRAQQERGRSGDRAWHGNHGAGDATGEAVSGLHHDQGGNHRTVELPELSDGDLTPLILGDWLEVVKPLMMDLSPQASRWWILVVEESYKYYHEWRRATPMERLHISPESMVVKMDPTLHRTEQRGISLLLKAIPSAVKETVIAERLLSTTGILFTLLKNFQPGGSSERTLLLKELSEIKVGKSPSEACAAIRSWRRFYTRTKEIEATVPDPIILLRALEPAVQLVSQLDAQATFRLAQSRAQLQVDARPEELTVWKYSECLLAELESLRLVQGFVTTSKTGTPNVKALHQQDGGAPQRPSTQDMPAGAGVCRSWGTTQGCRYGRACRFSHPPLPDQRDRCWNCSSTLHKKMECTARSGGGLGPQPGGVTGDGFNNSTSGKDGGGKGKKGGKYGNGKQDKSGASSGKKGEGRGNGGHRERDREEGGYIDKDKAKNNTENEKGKGAGDPSAQGGAGGDSAKPGQQASTSGTTGETGSTQALMSEVTSLLKSMRVTQGESRSSGQVMKPAINAVRLKRIEVGRESTVLLDGGATNCMRKAKSWKEYEEGLPVQVSLASGTAEMRQHRESGCVMSQAGRKLPVYLDGGCPVIGMREGMQLMEQVEAFYMRRARLRVAAVRPQPNYQDLEMVEASNFAEDYPQVPLRLVERIPGRVRWDPDLVPLNRRMRKRLQRAKSIVIHLFSGTNTEIWDSHDQEGLVFLNIEIKRGTDMHNDHLFGFLEQLCQSGRVRGVFAGPPCRTVSLLRFQQEEGGPKPLRGRENEARFGLPWLSEEEQREADDDSVLWLRTLQLMTVALDESMECAIGLEQPEDPANWKEDDENLHGGWGYPSFMVWPETVAFAQFYGLDFVNFDQKLLGHKRKKPTTMVTNIGTIKALQGRRSTTPDPPWPRTLRERMEESAGLAEWATGLQLLLREVAVLLHGRAEQRRQRNEVIRHQAKRSVWTMRPDRMPQRMMALSMKDQEELAEWQRHVDNDHKPYRRDCEECLRSMGRDRMRKRIECPDSYALNLDIMGPVNRGEDQDGTGFYYALVGAFTVPCVGDNPIAQGLQELGHAQSPNIMVDEEDSHKLWTSKEVVAEIEELKKHHGANYVQDISTGEDK